MTKLDKTFYGEYIATPQKKYATRLTTTLKTGIACAMLTMIVGTANAGAVGDVTFNDVASDSFIENGLGSIKSEDLATVTNYANDNQLFFDTGLPPDNTAGTWTGLLQSKKGALASGAYEGITFSLTASGTKEGTWTLAVSPWSDPFQMDFLVFIHGGNNSAFYFFDDREIKKDNAGTFTITFKNKGGNPPDLSNFDILARDLRSIENGGGGGSEIPEPTSLLLFGAGLLGFGLNRRRKQA